MFKEIKTRFTFFCPTCGAPLKIEQSLAKTGAKKWRIYCDHDGGRRSELLAFDVVSNPRHCRRLSDFLKVLKDINLKYEENYEL